MTEKHTWLHLEQPVLKLNTMSGEGHGYKFVEEEVKNEIKLIF